MNLFATTCLAEEAAELEKALEDVTKTEALMGGTIMGVAIGMAIAIGIVGIVLIFMQSMRLARSFGKGTGFGVGLFLLGPIFRLILGFGSAEYIGAQD